MPPHLYGFICTGTGKFCREVVISPEIKGKEVVFRIAAPYAATVNFPDHG